LKLPCPADTLGKAIKSGIDKYRKTTDSQTAMKKIKMSLEKEKCFRWVHAGHESALSYNPATDAFDTLGGKGLALGVMEDSVYTEANIQIHPGQIILIGTDGLKEACNPQNELFGNERLQMVMKDNYRKSAKDILDEVFAALENFRGSAERKDDETLVVIKVKSDE
jgi:sigma-B regulation protein RsbU (phosphoserine phosphatase)